MEKTGERLLTSKNWMFDHKTSHKFKIRRAPISICLPLQQVLILHNIFVLFDSIFLVANSNPIIAIFQTRAAHIILNLIIFIKGGGLSYVFHQSITFILFLFSCKIISIFLFKLNSNQMCFLFLDSDCGMAFGIHSEQSIL